MSEIFNKDAQFNAAAPNVPAAGLGAILTTNFLTPPFGTCKGVVKAMLEFTPDAGTTAFTVALVRNPNGENVTIATISYTDVAGAAQKLQGVAMAVDQIPDGRDVQYQLQVSQTAAGGVGTAVKAFIEAELISG